MKAFVMEAREEFDAVGEIHLFNNEGEEIYPPINPFIKTLAEDITAIQAIQQNNFSGSLHPLINAPSCQSCHGDDHELRGAVRLTMAEKVSWDKALVQVVHRAFQAIMLSGKGEFADSLLLDINSIMGVNLTQVYDEDGIYVAFGNDETEIDEDLLEELAEDFHESPQQNKQVSEAELHFAAFNNLGDCHVCHGSDSQVRGILAMGLQADKVNQSVVTKAVISGFSNLMKLKRASYAGAYVDAIRELPFIQSFEIFDNGQESELGVRNLWVPNPDFAKVEMDSAAFHLIKITNQMLPDSSSQEEYIEQLNEVDHLTQIVPIINDEKCQACHNPPQEDSPLYESQKDIWKVRSVVKVSTSIPMPPAPSVSPGLPPPPSEYKITGSLNLSAK